MAGRYSQQSEWETYQVMFGPDEEVPVEQVIAESGSFPAAVVTKLRLLRELGWPDARNSLLDDKGKRLIALCDPGEPRIWVFKAKPHCWRLYFYVNEKRKFYGFVYAICKKKTAEDPADAAAARRQCTRLHAGGRLTQFPL